MAGSEPLADLYDGLECGMCGNSLSPGVWCGDAGEAEDCPLAFDGPESSNGGEEETDG
jgi:hypothetical protein